VKSLFGILAARLRPIPKAAEPEPPGGRDLWVVGGEPVALIGGDDDWRASGVPEDSSPARSPTT
jgi:hypothetical protein